MVTAVSPIDVLEQEEIAFEKATSDLDDLLRASSGLVRADVRGRAYELSRDCLVTSFILRDCHAEATSTLLETEQAEQERFIFRFGGGRAQPVRPEDRLRVTYKGLFLFIRAYQDAIYAVLFELLTGNRAGNVRMQNAVEKAGNPVGELLRSALTEYVDWFRGWRDLRNEVKEGTNFGIVGPAFDVGISFNSFTAGGGLYVEFREGRVIKLLHAVEAIYWSRRLAQCAFVVTEGRAKGVGVNPDP